MHAASSYSGRIGLVTFIECHFKLPPVSFVIPVHSQHLRSKAPLFRRLIRLVEWKSFVLDSIRNIHKSIADRTGRSRSCCLLVAAAITAAVAVSAAKAAVVAALTLTVSEFLVIY